MDGVQSKGWNWQMVSGELEDMWKNPAPEAFYLISRWKSQHKQAFLDLGCGLGRHSIFFAVNGFNVSAFDISKNAVERTTLWAKELNLNINIKQGDMRHIPFEDESMDCILCMNVISHTDTKGIRQIVSELKRVLKPQGECYLTLGSKETWGYKQNWPIVDENTKLRDEEGPEYMIPHFYADYDLIFQIFKDFDIADIKHVGTYYIHNSQKYESYHWHILIQKK